MFGEIQTYSSQVSNGPIGDDIACLFVNVFIRFYDSKGFKYCVEVQQYLVTLL